MTATATKLSCVKAEIVYYRVRLLHICALNEMTTQDTIMKDSQKHRAMMEGKLLQESIDLRPEYRPTSSV